MDSSTGKYCRLLEAGAGGPEALAAITGSRAYERFTGNQIAKMEAERAQEMRDCERISLVSSFVPSVILGDYAPIDVSDGSGMNLLDIHSHDWDDRLLGLVGPAMRAKLGQPVASSSVLGSVSPYFVRTFGLSPDCKVVAFTGDNPSSLAGMRLETGDIVASLGTSDTLFLSLEQPSPKLQGHIFCNPVESAAYIALLCYQNGSLTREWAKDTFAGGSWEVFDQHLDRTPPGLGGRLGFYYLVPEITPTVAAQTHRFDAAGHEVNSFEDAATETRAVVEGHFLGLRAHSEGMGFRLGSRLLVTGGASVNRSLLQVLADVFGVRVFAMDDSSNSASLGGCFRALVSASL